MMSKLNTSVFFVVTTLLVTSVYGWSQSGVPSRRDVFRSIATVGSGIAFVEVTTSSRVANAIEACPSRSSNCIRTTWTAPADTDVPKTLAGILNSYPQEGQADVDLGGWSIAEGDLSSGDTKARYEYSSGVGKFAKFFNGGKPFIDDLKVEVTGSTVEIRSSSRVGDSDFDVNKKRLLFLGAKAKELGWTVPEPKY